MLEVCPLIAEEKPRLEVHFLGIGIRKSLTARLVFTSRPNPGITATVVDLGNRFRLIANDVECIKSKPLPKAPRGIRSLDSHAQLRDRRGCMDSRLRHSPLLLLLRASPPNTGKTTQRSQASRWHTSTPTPQSRHSRIHSAGTRCTTCLTNHFANPSPHA